MSKDSVTTLLPRYLRRSRVDAGLSQLDLAILMGIHPRTVQSVEGERCWPSSYTIRTWERVCRQRMERVARPKATRAA